MLIKKKKGEGTGSSSLTLKTTDQQPYEVPMEGSLGLLALGHLGLQAWRAKRTAHATQQFDQDKKEEGDST